jgi:glycosyltransferase involved in cell wall biosynthesis
MTAPSAAPRVCVIIPCLDEAPAIAGVVRDFRREVPEARIVVVDNGSTDDTANVARAAGAEVIVEPRRGKARAMLTAFARVDADVVIVVDGDGSYPAAGAALLLARYREQPCDMLTGVRVSADPRGDFRPMHQAGTRAFEVALDLVFGFRSRDLFSGLRLFSASFYQNVPILSRGFEVELELTIQAVEKGFHVAELDVPFTTRAEGTASKLRSVQDGLRILRFLFLLFRDYRPVRFFGVISLAFACMGLAAGSLPVLEYIRGGTVGRFPLAFLAASLEVIAILTMQVGVIVEGTLRYAREAFQVRVRQHSLARGARP